MTAKTTEKPVLIDPADPTISIDEAIQKLIEIGESPRNAKQQVMVARGLWQASGRLLTRCVDGEEIGFIAD
jgi:hypothetical protein